jgi:hypothetical protein
MTTANQKGHTAARRRQLAPKARKALLTKKAARTGKASGASLKKQLLGEVRNLRGEFCIMRIAYHILKDICQGLHELTKRPSRT